MKVRSNTNSQAKARGTKIRHQRLTKISDQNDRLKGLLKPVSFDEE